MPRPPSVSACSRASRPFAIWASSHSALSCSWRRIGEGPAEPYRVGRQLALAAVAFVEDQVDDGEDRGQPVGEQVGGRHPKRDPGGPDLALGAEEALCHRLLGNEEGASDFGGGQTPKRS